MTFILFQIKTSFSLLQAKRNKISQEQVKLYKVAFDKYDENKDGKISAKELGDVMHLLGRPKPDEATLQEMIQSIDKDGNSSLFTFGWVCTVSLFYELFLESGFIEFDEFVTFFIRQIRMSIYKQNSSK